jgi:DNA polymerase III delta prime subunit
LKNEIKIAEEKIVSTAGLIDILYKSFSTYTRQNIIKKHPSVFIQGQPGIGKSQAVIQIAEMLHDSLKKEVIIHDVRLLLFNPIDLRGIPVADYEEKVAIWLRPKIFQMDSSDEVINILFLDELTAAPGSLQAAAYQIALDRRLGEHKLPDNTFIIAAGNRNEDNAITYEMPTSLRNRFIHFELKIDFSEWVKWANQNHIHTGILKFLNDNPDKFATKDFETNSNIIITPRSWEYLSNILKVMGGTLEENEIYIASVIGNSLTYLMLNQKNPITIQDILNGQYEDNPENMSDLQRIVDILINQIKEYSINKAYMSNILNFMTRIPTDYGITLFREIVKLDIKDYEITELENYNNFMRKLEGYKQDER